MMMENFSHPKRYYTEGDAESAVLWPYRTTPLVLPGAKVKKDAPPTESYLRHHPNPAMRASPHHQLYLPHDVLMKQKVADSVIQKVVGEDAAAKQVVHKQFNSPIGLYSDQNIKDTIHSQTGVTPTLTVHTQRISNALKRQVIGLLECIVMSIQKSLLCDNAFKCEQDAPSLSSQIQTTVQNFSKIE